MTRRTTKIIKYVQSVLILLIILIPLMILVPFSDSTALAEDNLNCNLSQELCGGSPFPPLPLPLPDADCDFFTGHCTDGGPFDEPDPPKDEEPEFPDSEPSPSPSPLPPPPPPPQLPSEPVDDPLPPVCRVRPSLPQCN